MARNGTGRGTQMARTARLNETLPEGITIGEWPDDGRRKRFYIRSGPQRKVESFASEELRNDKADTLADLQKQHGQIDYDPAEWKDWQAFKQETGATVSEVRLLWAQVRGNRELTMEVGRAVSRYLELRRGEGLAEDSLRHMKTILERFAVRYGHLRLVSLTADHVRDWLSDLQKAHSFSSTTLRHHRKEVASLYSRAMREKWALENPCDAVVPPKIVSRERPILSLQDAFQFFKVAIGSPIGSRLAVEAFAGLRVSSSARLKEDEIKHEEGGIVLPAAKHKLERRFFVDGFPGNVFDWLDLPAQRWDISESTYDQYKARAFLAAGVKNPGNVLRHSFCTYHIAGYGDASKTATLLTHRSASTLYQHYRGRGVTRAQGLAYFLITPKTAKLTFEQFYAHAQRTTQRDLRIDAPRNRRAGNAPGETEDLERHPGRA